MPDINDVVRHVILRLVVDQAGFADQLRSAQSKLGELKKSEAQSNKDRAKDFEKVTKAIEAQRQALVNLDNARSALSRQSTADAQEQAQSHRESAAAIQSEAKAIGDNAIAQAKADAIREKSQIQNAALSAKLDAEQKERDKSNAAAHREFNKQIAVERDQQIASFNVELDQALAKLAETNAKIRNVALTGQTRRVIARDTAAAKIARDDETAARNSARRDETTRREQDRKQEREAAEHAQELVSIQLQADEKLRTTRERNRATEASGKRKQAESERAAAAKNAVAELLAAQTFTDTVETILDNNASSRRRQTGLADTADNNARRAATLANAAPVKVENEEIRARQQISNLISQQTLLDQRALEIMERRARAAERESKQRRSVESPAKQLLLDFQTAARAFADFRRDFRATQNEIADADGFRRADGAIKGFVRQIAIARNETGGLGRGIAQTMRQVAAEVRHAGREAGTENIGRNIRQSLSVAVDSVRDGMRNIARSALSFRGLIIGVIAALGPLSAILGAVSAAALGLAGDLVALVGALGALPSAIGTIVAGFGALQIALSPLGDAFDAFTKKQQAAQDATTGGAKAARDAARALIDARRALQDAQLENARAIEDLPLAERRLHEARRQAARDIQDYRLALQKLRYEQESAELGVLSAEQEYRRALADPTKNSLDRRIARNNVVGALFDRRDQKIAEGRLREDAALAELRGIEGSDAVVAARRAQEDANRRLEDSVIRLRRAEEDLREAQLDRAAGGSAARKAADALEAALGKLHPSARKVVEAIHALDDEYRALQRRLQGRIFDGISRDTEKFAGLLQLLESFVGPAADSFGFLASKVLELLSTSEWKTFIADEGQRAGSILSTLGQAGINAAEGIKNLVRLARPLTDFIVNGILRFTEKFQALTESGTGQAGITEFFRSVVENLGDISTIVGNVVEGIGKFYLALNAGGKEGESFMDRFNGGLIRITDRFVELAEKAADPNGGFQKWLRDVYPLLQDVGGLIKAIGVFFGDLFSNPANLREASNILNEISEVWLPNIAIIFDKLSESGFLSKLAKAIGTVFETIVAFLDGGGTEALSFFGSVLLAVANAVNILFDKIPGLSSVIVALVAAFATLAALVAGAGLVGLIIQFTRVQLAAQLLLGTIKALFAAIKSGSGLRGFFGSLADQALGRDKNVRQAEKQVERDSKTAERGGNVPDRTNTGGVLPTMYRMEKHLQTIIAILRRCCGLMGGGLDDGPDRRNRPTGPVTGGGGGAGASTGSDTRRPRTRRGGVPGAPSATQTAARDAVLRQQQRIADGPGRGGATGFVPTGLIGPQPRPPLAGADRPRTEPGYRPSRPSADSLSPAQRRREEQNRRYERATYRPGPFDGQDPLAPRYYDASGKQAQFPDARRPARPDTLLPQVTQSIDPQTGRPVTSLRMVPAQAPVPSFTGSGGPAFPGYVGAPVSPPPDPRRDRTTSQPSPRNTTPVAAPATPSQRRLTTTELADVRQAANRPRPFASPATRGAFLLQDLLPGLFGVPTRPSLATPDFTPPTGPSRPRLAVPDFVPPAPVVVPADPRRERTTTQPPQDRPKPSGPRPNRATRRNLLLSALNDLPQFTDEQDVDQPVDRRQATTTAPTFVSGAPQQPERGDTPVPRRGSTRPEFFTGERPPRDSGGRFLPGGSVQQPRNERGQFIRRPRPDDAGFIGAPYAFTGETPRRQGGLLSTLLSNMRSRFTGGTEPDRDLAAEQRERRENQQRDRVDRNLLRSTQQLTSTNRQLAQPPTRQPRVRTGGRFGFLADAALSTLPLLGLAAASAPQPQQPALSPATDSYTDPRRTQPQPGIADSASSAMLLAGGLPLSPRRAQTTPEPERTRTPSTDRAPRTPRSSSFFKNLRPGRLAGGPVGLIASIAAQLAGGAAIDKYVRDDEDNASMQRGLGAVATGAGAGALLGSLIFPGVGTAIGGAVGAVGGGAYSLYKDKNLRSFLGGKAQTASNAVSDYFTGASDPKPAAGQGAKQGPSTLSKVASIAAGPIGLLANQTDIGKSIMSSLDRAREGISEFFTKTIPGMFNKGVRGITRFFTKTLPELPLKAFDVITTGLGVAFGFLVNRLPRIVRKFFTQTLPDAAAEAWESIQENLWQPFEDFVRSIPGFFTETIPLWFDSLDGWLESNVREPIRAFVTEDIPNFFAETLPRWFENLPENFQTYVITPIITFFTETLPTFFTETLPQAIATLPSFLYSNLIQPVLDFFAGLRDHVGDFLAGSFDWARSLFERGSENFERGAGTQRRMSGGLITGIYQGIEDKAHVLATPGEFMVRRSKVMQPGGKQFLIDYNEGRIDPAMFYAALNQPPVMTVAPPSMPAVSTAAATTSYVTNNSGLTMGDITINNPVRERAEHSLRRAVRTAALRKW